MREGAASDSNPRPVDDATLDRVLELVLAREGVDLRAYRRAPLARRVQNRMISASAPTAAAYLERLQRDPEEASRLLERLTIKVSRFFRNADAYAMLARTLQDDLTRAPRPLSAWCAGCGQGEEAFSLAILLDRLGQPPGAAQVVATDVDRAALAAARAATYREAALAEAPQEVRARYLEATGAPGEVRPVASVRGRVVFQHHDLAGAAAPPAPGRFDLVSCRNTLIYFDAALQRRALALLCGALAPGGLLWLGEAEWPPPELARGLRPVDRRARLFRRRAGERGDA